MNSAHSSVARVISTGFLVSFIFSIVLFWTDAVLRKIGKDELVGRERMSMSLPLDLGDKNLSDPNLAVRAPRVSCEFADDRFLESDIFLDICLGALNWITGYQKEPYSWQFGFDLKKAQVNAKWHVKQGLIVAEEVHTDLEEEEPTPRIRYVGPEGFGDTPDKALGRFSNPQLCYREYPRTVFVYDADLKVFFRIDFALEKVTSKSWADKSIIATSRGQLSQFDNLLRLRAHGAHRDETDQEMKTRVEKEGRDLEDADYLRTVGLGPSVERIGSNYGFLAIDDQGTIYVIDRDTLLLSPPKGRLPRCGKERTRTPSRLLAYSASPLFVDRQYFGLVAVSLSRDGSEAVMGLLDSKGHEIGLSKSNLKPRHYQYGMITSYTRTVLDFAQPLVFSAASSLWGPRTEAIAGYRSLFVLPLSMPGRIAGDRTLKPGDRYGTLVMWNVLTWCVGLLLAIAVIRDLKQHGMPGKTQKAWLFACMGFGWIAAITYLLTRPRTRFVTCTGCGRTRRTDQALCLHCEADWQMCELQAPGWRVVD